METLKEIIEILGEAPEMALWGVVVWCLFVLAKLASIVYAVKVVAQLAINKWAEIQAKKLDQSINDDVAALAIKQRDFAKVQAEWEIEKGELALKNYEYNRIVSYLERIKIHNVPNEELIRVLDAIKGDGVYIHQSDVDNAVRAIRESDK